MLYALLGAVAIGLVLGLLGLGLALADRVARSNGGRLTLDGAEPHGLRAILTVPAAP